MRRRALEGLIALISQYNVGLKLLSPKKLPAQLRSAVYGDQVLYGPWPWQSNALPRNKAYNIKGYTSQIRTGFVYRQENGASRRGALRS
jgi:hypothetical protein